MGIIYHRAHDPYFKVEDDEAQMCQSHTEDSSAPESWSLHFSPISDFKAAFSYGVDSPGINGEKEFVVLGFLRK